MGNVRKLLSRASAAGARVCIILGEEELRSGVAVVKDLNSGVQVSERVDFNDRLREGGKGQWVGELVKTIKNILN
jgi:histidyl-tRNA synthetase